MFLLFIFTLDVQSKFIAKDLYEYSSELDKHNNLHCNPRNSMFSAGDTKEWMKCVENGLKDDNNFEGKSAKRSGDDDGSDAESGSGSKSGQSDDDDSGS